MMNKPWNDSAFPIVVEKFLECKYSPGITKLELVAMLHWTQKDGPSLKDSFRYAEMFWEYANKLPKE